MAAAMVRLPWYHCEYNALISQPFFTALSISCIGGAFSGVGVHQERLSPEEQVTGMQVCQHLDLYLMITS
jgi:hypothetical protein